MTKADRKHWNHMQIHILIRKMESGDLPLVIRDGRIWGYEMDRQEIDRAYREAWSFPGLMPPDGACYIGCRKNRTGMYLFWKDQAGRYWYDTERGMAFKRSMEEVQKKNGIQRQLDAGLGP